MKNVNLNDNDNDNDNDDDDDDDNENYYNNENKNKMKNKKLQTLRLMGCLAGLVFMMFSCGSDSEVANTFDPSKPIVCESFYPSGGPISTQVILKGSNFGSDKNAVRVFFNEKEAPVINVNEDHILVPA